MVSFVVPALNAAATLEPCLTSILTARRAGVDVEVFLVDNGSTDRTVDIARRMGVTVLSGPGLTVGALRNLGASRAKGDVLAFVDADCVIAPDWLEAGLATFADPQVAAAGSPTHVPLGGTWVERAWELHRHRTNRRKLVDWLPTVSLLVRRASFDAVGGFNSALATCEDVDLGYRLAADHRLVSDPGIRSVHLGEPRTLWRFLTKEIWRGQQNLSGILSHGLRRSELPSLGMPVFCAVAVVSLPVAIALGTASGRWHYALVAASMLTLPPVLLAIGTSVKTRRVTMLPHLAILYLAYALGRAIALAAGALPLARPPRAARGTAGAPPIDLPVRD